MKDPFLTKSGNTYEKSNLLEYIAKYGKDPLDEKPLNAQQIMSNLSLKSLIENFLNENPWAYEYSEDDTIDKIKFN